MSEPSRRAVVFARVTTGVAGVLLGSQAIFAAQLHRRAALYASVASFLVIAAVVYKLGPKRRVDLALALLLVLGALYGAEAARGRMVPYDGSAAARRGVAFDTRSRWEVVSDLRKSGKQATYPSIPPRDLLKFDHVTGVILPAGIAPHPGVPIDGRDAMPLAGISGSTAVFCNEGGAYAIYETDERGFNNPHGVWSAPVEIGILGDSFLEGACVPREATVAELLRKKRPGVLNLGMSGNGPLYELAGVEEYLADKKPKTVLFFYYDNDMGDLAIEAQSPILKRYLEPGFRQGLDGKQAQIDEGLREVLANIERQAEPWPASLASMGLTRASAPMWFQDLVMGEQHSSAAGALRLDRLNQAVTGMLARKGPAGAPPDFALYKTVLAKAKKTVESWGGTLIVVYLPDVHQLYAGEHPNRRPVLAAIKEVGARLIDAHPPFVAAKDKAKLRYHEGSHLSVEGYALLAEVILAAL